MLQRQNRHPPPAEPVRTKVVVGWNKVTLAAVRATRVSPPVAARPLAVVHSAMFNAWAAYDSIAVSTRQGALLRRPVGEHSVANAIKAVSFAAYGALLDQFPTQKAAFDAHMALLAFIPAHASPDFTAPEGVGTIAARVMVESAHGDGANQLGDLTASGVAFADYSAYTPRNVPMLTAQPTAAGAIAFPDRWQPLSYPDSTGALRTQQYLLPFWGQVRPFALTGGAQFRPGAPAAFGSHAFAEQARSIVATQGALSEVQKAMVDYWAGGTTGELPSSLWSQFAQFISARDRHTEADDIKLFFALSNAVFDAGIAAWDAKRAYDSARLIAAVRHLMAGQDIRSYGVDGSLGSLHSISGQSWMPYQLPTNPCPPHPDYVSGHST